MKNLGQSTRSNMTSFHGHVFTATPNELRQVLGDPAWENNNGEDKTNIDWTMETEDGEVFTVYDWKEYRPLQDDEDIEWHIGGHEAITTGKAKEEIETALRNL